MFVMTFPWCRSHLQSASTHVLPPCFLLQFLQLEAWEAIGSSFNLIPGWVLLVPSLGKHPHRVCLCVHFESSLINIMMAYSLRCFISGQQHQRWRARVIVCCISLIHMSFMLYLKMCACLCCFVTSRLSELRDCSSTLPVSESRHRVVQVLACDLSSCHVHQTAPRTWIII